MPCTRHTAGHVLFGLKFEAKAGLNVGGLYRNRACIQRAPHVNTSLQLKPCRTTAWFANTDRSSGRKKSKRQINARRSRVKARAGAGLGPGQGKD